MDLVVQKATELGVAAIVPVATARSVVKLDAASRDRKSAHWRAIAISACEQCGRARIPVIAEPLPFGPWLAASPGTGLRLLLSPDADASLSSASWQATEVELLVGPEGGLDEAERRAALDAGYRACRLGPRVLRSETAAIAAIAVLQSLRGDLG
jgi:16S rRNA (uracil1498-N3)-methyltransferase